MARRSETGAGRWRMTRTLPVPASTTGGVGRNTRLVPPEFSSHRSLALGFLTVVVLVGGVFGWGAFASISGAVIATGQVEVETRDQPVEHIDGGTVGAILVRDGDHVAAGEVLIRLDDAQLRSEAALLEAEAAVLAARRNRLEAEFVDAATIGWDAWLADRADDDASVQSILDGERRLFEARNSSREGQAAQLRERIGQMRKQILGLQSQAEAVKRQSGFVARELAAQRSLFEKGLTELPRLLALEREAAQLDGQAGDIAARIAGARGRIAEIEIQILQIDARRVEKAQDQAREVQAEENQVHERLASVRRWLGRMEIRAPVAGEVYGMEVNAIGEVVRPGEPILKIVPEDAGLVVVAQLEPIHVDQVHAGQEAVLLFSAFPARVTPEYLGRIERVSADVTRDERSGFEWYEVDISIGGPVQTEGRTELRSWAAFATDELAHLLPEGFLREKATAVAEEPREPSVSSTEALPELALTPGMPVEVHVRTGERSPLSYLMKPLTDYFGRSMREE